MFVWDAQKGKISSFQTEIDSFIGCVSCAVWEQSKTRAGRMIFIAQTHTHNASPLCSLNCTINTNIKFASCNISLEFFACSYIHTFIYVFMAIHFYFTAHAIISILDDFFFCFFFYVAMSTTTTFERKKFLTLFYTSSHCWRRRELFSSEKEANINTSDFPLPPSSLTWGYK